MKDDCWVYHEKGHCSACTLMDLHLGCISEVMEKANFIVSGDFVVVSGTHTHSLLRLIHCQNVSGVTFILLLFKTEYSSDIMANGKLFKITKHSDLYIIIFQFIEDRYPFDFCFCLCFLGFIMCLYLCFLCELMQFETKHSDLHKILS